LGDARESLTDRLRDRRIDNPRASAHRGKNGGDEGVYVTLTIPASFTFRSRRGGDIAGAFTTGLGKRRPGNFCHFWREGDGTGLSTKSHKHQLGRSKLSERGESWRLNGVCLKISLIRGGSG